MNIAVQILLTVIGSGAVFSFLQFIIQFFVTRKDNKEREAKEDKFEELRAEIKSGLDAREEVGRGRYEEHKRSIDKILIEHKEDFGKLLEAIEQLRDNDTKVSKALEELAVTNTNIAGAVVGLAHDKLVYSTDKIAERGYITVKEKATLRSIYEPYTSLGGNSHAREGYLHVMDLPVVTDEEAKNMDRVIEKNKLK